MLCYDNVVFAGVAQPIHASKVLVDILYINLERTKERQNTRSSGTTTKWREEETPSPPPAGMYEIYDREQSLLALPVCRHYTYLLRFILSVELCVASSPCYSRRPISFAVSSYAAHALPSFSSTSQSSSHEFYFCILIVNM